MFNGEVKGLRMGTAKQYGITPGPRGTVIKRFPRGWAWRFKNVSTWVAHYPTREAATNAILNLAKEGA